MYERYRNSDAATANQPGTDVQRRPSPLAERRRRAEGPQGYANELRAMARLPLGEYVSAPSSAFGDLPFWRQVAQEVHDDPESFEQLLAQHTDTTEAERVALVAGWLAVSPGEDSSEQNGQARYQ